MDKFYRPEEISRLLKVAPATPYKWIREGKLPVHRLGKCLRVAREDLEEFLRQRRCVKAREACVSTSAMSKRD